MHLKLDGLYRACRRKVQGFCQPDRQATEQVARGSRPGQPTGVHHTASVFGVTEEEARFEPRSLGEYGPSESNVRRIRVWLSREVQYPVGQYRRDVPTDT